MTTRKAMAVVLKRFPTAYVDWSPTGIGTGLTYGVWDCAGGWEPPKERLSHGYKTLHGAWVGAAVAVKAMVLAERAARR